MNGKFTKNLIFNSLNRYPYYSLCLKHLLRNSVGEPLERCFFFCQKTIKYVLCTHWGVGRRVVLLNPYDLHYYAMYTVDEYYNIVLWLFATTFSPTPTMEFQIRVTVGCSVGRYYKCTTRVVSILFWENEPYQKTSLSL